jgi:non-ribosomal peptide synthetase component F
MDLQVAWTPAQQDTVTAVLARSSAAFGDRVFLDFTGDSYSYAEIDKQSTRLARSLQQLGVKKGDTVASILDYNLHAVLAWFAINKRNHRDRRVGVCATGGRARGWPREHQAAHPAGWRADLRDSRGAAPRCLPREFGAAACGSQRTDGAGHVDLYRRHDRPVEGLHARHLGS